MAKPKSIILVRHGQSEGNVDKNIYKVKPDYALRLTEEGQAQATDIGKHLKEELGIDNAMFYVSPYFRTRETAEHIRKSISTYKYYEDPRLREQEWLASFRDGKRDFEELEKDRNSYGHFYYRFPNGESCADCFDRVGSFLESLYRDFQDPNYPENVVIVSHGMLMRLFLMRWFHYTVEDFERMKNPINCGIYKLELQESGRYAVSSEIQYRDNVSNAFLYHENAPTGDIVQ